MGQGESHRVQLKEILSPAPGRSKPSINVGWGPTSPKAAFQGRLFSLEKKVILPRCNKYLVVGSKDSRVQQEATGTN